MATQNYYYIQCHKKYPTHQKLFDTLNDFSKMAPEDCSACGGARELHLTLDFSAEEHSPFASRTFLGPVLIDHEY